MPVTRTLALLDTKAQHTATQLRKILLTVLEEYNINTSQVLACDTDNASNMVKLVKDLNKEDYLFKIIV